MASMRVSHPELVCWRRRRLPSLIKLKSQKSQAALRLLVNYMILSSCTNDDGRGQQKMSHLSQWCLIQAVVDLKKSARDKPLGKHFR